MDLLKNSQLYSAKMSFEFLFFFFNFLEIKIIIIVWQMKNESMIPY